MIDEKEPTSIEIIEQFVEDDVFDEVRDDKEKLYTSGRIGFLLKEEGFFEELQNNAAATAVKICMEQLLLDITAEYVEVWADEEGHVFRRFAWDDVISVYREKSEYEALADKLESVAQKLREKCNGMD